MKIPIQKYLLTVRPKAGTAFNPVHESVDSTTAVIIELEEGKRGWLSCWFGVDDWHRLHTSVVQSISVDQDGNIAATTENSIYQLTKYSEVDA